MPRTASNDGLDKFQRYRAGQLTRGRKLVRIWTSDPAAEGFHEDAARQANLLRGAVEEREALDFIESTADFVTT